MGPASLRVDRPAAPGKQDDADEILAAAAREGVDLAGLAGLAQEMYERAHRDGDGVPDGFGDRALWLDTTLGGAGRLTGDLTAGCSAALSAVLESLGKRAGQEDVRTAAQRRHDALAEARRRLIAAGMLPDRAGQPTQVQVHVTLSQLRDLPGASAAEAAWAQARASQPGWLAGPEADAAGCDSTVVPIVTGHVDWTVLDHLTGVYLASKGLRPDGSSGCGCTCGGCSCPERAPLPPATVARLRQTMLRLAADAMSGPGGLASWLRTSQLTGGPGASPGLPSPSRCRWIPAKPSPPSRPTCGGPCLPATGDVASPAARFRRWPARSITSCRDPGAAQPRCATSARCARSTTSLQSTGGAGRWRSAPTERSLPPAPTGASCPATAHHAGPRSQAPYS